MRFSFINVALQALKHNSGWPEQWRNAQPKAAYDAVIIGAGGHGLATAYYLAANHGIRKVAVLERGYLGSGNVGRNTTIVRSNYQIDGNTLRIGYKMSGTDRPQGFKEMNVVVQTYKRVK